MANGKIVQVTGPVVDVEFPPGEVPEIYTALTTGNPSIDERDDNLTIEVALHLGENTVRCIAMDTTDGLRRGQDVKNTDGPIMVPVGPGTLGRIMNVVGEPVDEKGEIEGVRKDGDATTIDCADGDDFDQPASAVSASGGTPARSLRRSPPLLIFS